MLASALLGATTTTRQGERGESTAALGRLLVGLLRHLENLGQRLALVGAHRLLDVSHPRATLSAIHGSSGNRVGHFVFTREKI